MGKALKIRDKLSAEVLRKAARQETDGRAAARMYAIALSLLASRTSDSRLSCPLRKSTGWLARKSLTPEGIMPNAPHAIEQPTVWKFC